MMIGAAVERIGLTQKGVGIWFALRSIFQELMVETGYEGGEPIFRGGPRSPEMINRRWEELWRSVAGIEHDPIYVEILGELVDRPRRPREVVQRIVKKEPSMRPAKIESAMEILLKTGVMTMDPEAIYVA